MKILMADVGGTNVKLMVSGNEEVRKVPSGRELTAVRMVESVLGMTEDWEYEAVSLGYPGIVRDGKVARESLNLGNGWVNFDFEKAFKRPVRVINDAALQALAIYDTGRLLYLGLGTSVGAAIIADDTVLPLEIGIMPVSKSEAFMDRLSKEALDRLGRRRWQKAVTRAVALLHEIFWPDHFRLGGGNARLLDPVPAGCECGNNQDAFTGARRLWSGADMLAEAKATTWRITRHRSPDSKG